ncbi:molybdenum cofactor biosynthesis protein [Marinicauda pacifica]|uniref:Competence/damage-inducible protein A n=1 Tax=Marinicauda pacifica TaxID=1133559 RepID=A0A4S2HDE1_9PROT|nr:molybdopterin-binding protein [Marinicauda pacifica]TGY93863.1 competence/damage-inducible protein A [Marinicauda pacifica]GGE30969.1 molybdenum cofactor biosynthesis protein [Marinicauda pacifica]
MGQRRVSAGIVVIGDEILSGRTQDINVQQIAQFLTPLGVSVREVRIVADVTAAIGEAVNTLRERCDYVFTTGGIGPTHDDITADAIAEAFGCEIGVRDDARAILERWYEKTGTEITEARLRMARIPHGASLIENPVTGAPGFQIANVFVMAGVPKIVRGMLEDVAPRIEGGAVTYSVSVRLENVREGDIAAELGELQERYEDVSIGSYPWFEDEGEKGLRRGIVLIARSTDKDVLDTLKSQFQAFETS